MRGGGVKSSAGRRAGGFLKIGVLPAWELYFGVIWVDTYRHRFGTTFGSILESFGSYFGVILESLNVVEAAPQARPKTTAVANTALRPSPCRPPSFNALPVPMLRQVYVLPPKQSSHAGKTHFFRKVRVLR